MAASGRLFCQYMLARNDSKLVLVILDMDDRLRGVDVIYEDDDGNWLQSSSMPELRCEESSRGIRIHLYMRGSSRINDLTPSVVTLSCAEKAAEAYDGLVELLARGASHNAAASGRPCLEGSACMFSTGGVYTV